MVWKIIGWDICPHLHAQNDFGYKDGDRTKFSRVRTYQAECYKYKDSGRKFNKKKDCCRICLKPILVKEDIE